MSLLEELQEMLYQVNVKHCGQEAAEAARDTTLDLQPLATMLAEQAEKYPLVRSALVDAMRHVDVAEVSRALPPELFDDLEPEQVTDLLAGVFSVLEKHA